MREIFIVWFITIVNVSFAKYCDKKNSPSADSIAILKEYCNINNGSLNSRECTKGNKTIGYKYCINVLSYIVKYTKCLDAAAEAQIPTNTRSHSLTLRLSILY